MKQLLIDTCPFKYTNQKVNISESKKSPRGNLMVSGLLATAEVENGNGRFYSKALWEREINKYSTLVEENRACGELDHCFIEGYKILTKEKGWVYFKDLEGNESVATLNVESRELEYQKIEENINKPYKGEIINIESKTFQANVTPNHKFIVETKTINKNLKFKLATELNSTDIIPNHQNPEHYIADCKIYSSQYEGNIYCVTVPNHTILVMSPNGSTFWSGNSSEEIINLKNISHNITKVWWDGNKVYGDIEILPTPSGNILKTLLENNILVGVSSRGLGSLEKRKDGLMEVQDDFELVCWDFISTPSNPGSWIQLKKPLNESLNRNWDKYNNINNIIREILIFNS